MQRAPAFPAAVLLVVVLTGCAGLGRAGMIARLEGTVAVERKAGPPAVYLDDPKAGRWRLEGGVVDDLRELDGAVVEVRGVGHPRDPLRSAEPGRFEMHLYRLVQVGGKPALVGTLAWEGSDLMLVELDRDDRRVALAGPVLRRLPALMGKTIWVAGEPRQGTFLVERYGVLRR